MKSKVFNWTKNQKTPHVMEAQINEFLKENSFKFAMQNESNQTGRVMLTILYEPANKANPAKNKATVVRTSGPNNLQNNLDKQMQTLKNVAMSTQSCSGNTITSIVFHGR